MPALSAILVFGAWDIFPVKSINESIGDPISFYTFGSNYQTGLNDGNVVHGIEAADGSFILVGRGVNGAHAVRFDWQGNHVWTWNSGVVREASNQVMQLPNGGDILIAGLTILGGVYYRSVTRLALVTGSVVYNATGFGDSPGSHGAWETMDFTYDKTGVLLGGFRGKPNTNEFEFKSGGNTAGGTATVMR